MFGINKWLNHWAKRQLDEVEKCKKNFIPCHECGAVFEEDRMFTVTVGSRNYPKVESEEKFCKKCNPPYNIRVAGGFMGDSYYKRRVEVNKDGEILSPFIKLAKEWEPEKKESSEG